MYYTVIKKSGHLRTLEKYRKHSPAARVFYISLVFSNARRVLSQCYTQLRLLYLSNAVSEDDAQSDPSEMGDFIEHSCYEELFVPDTDVECVTVQSK